MHPITDTTDTHESPRAYTTQLHTISYVPSMTVIKRDVTSHGTRTSHEHLVASDAPAQQTQTQTQTQHVRINMPTEASTSHVRHESSMREHSVGVQERWNHHDSCSTHVDESMSHREPHTPASRRVITQEQDTDVHEDTTDVIIRRMSSLLGVAEMPCDDDVQERRMSLRDVHVDVQERETAAVTDTPVRSASVVATAPTATATATSADTAAPSSTDTSVTHTTTSE